LPQVIILPGHTSASPNRMRYSSHGVLSAAKLRLADLEKAERQIAAHKLRPCRYRRIQYK
jgi:hypothetical protein